MTDALDQARLKEALLDSLAVSRGGSRLRVASLLLAAIPAVFLLNAPWLIAWLVVLIIWNSVLVGPLERHFVAPLVETDLETARRRRAAMVFLGLALTQVLPLVAWMHGTAFAAAIATAWALSSATQVFVYYSRDRMLLAAGVAPIAACAAFAPLLSFGVSWEALAASLFMLMALVAGAAFVTRSDRLIAQAGEEAAARREAEASNVAKSRFIASMHHELRTPLNAIIGYSELLRETAVEESRTADAADLDRVLAAARTQLMMIGDLLAFSELQDGRLELELHDFDPAALARETAGVLRAGVEANNNSLVLDIPELGRGRSDPAKLRHCLEHLLSNAGKFTRRGVITLSARRERSDLVFTVADTGAGIAPDQQREIFEPFAQTDHGHGGKRGGLGLAITARIARLLGGAVSVESAPGNGSVFTLRVRAELGVGATTGQFPAVGFARVS